MKSIISIFGVFLAICWAVNVSAQTLLYQAEWDGSAFTKVGGTLSPTFSQGSATLSNGALVMGATTSTPITLDFSAIPIPKSPGATCVVIASQINAGCFVQFKQKTNGITSGLGLTTKNTGNYSYVFGTNYSWNTSTGGAVLTQDATIRSITMAYAGVSGIGTSSFIDGLLLMDKTGQLSSGNDFDYIYFGGMGNNTNINSGMNVYGILVLSGKLSAAQVKVVSDLELSIAKSRERIRSTVEGTEAGQFPAGSKATLQSWIDAAVAARAGDDAAKTTATANLNNGLNTYNNSIIKSATDKTITLVAAIGGTATITSPAGAANPAIVDQATSVTVTAIPATGYRFLKWVDATSGTDTDIAGATNASYTYTETADITLKAIFIKVYTVTLATSDAEAGSAGSFTEGGSSKTVDMGSSLTANANVRSGYTFIGWYNGTTLKSSSAVYTFNASEDATLTAYYTYARKLNVSTPSETYWYYITNKKGADLLLKSNGADQAITAETFSVNDAFLWKVVEMDGATYLVNKKDGTYLGGLNASLDFITTTVDNAKPFTVYGVTNQVYAKNSWGLDVAGAGKVNARGTVSGTKFTEYGVTADAGNAFHFIPVEGSGIPQESDINHTWFNFRTRAGWAKHDTANGNILINTSVDAAKVNNEAHQFKIVSSATEEGTYNMVVREEGVEKVLGFNTQLKTGESTPFDFIIHSFVSGAAAHSIDDFTGAMNLSSYFGLRSKSASINLNEQGGLFKHYGSNDGGNGIKLIAPDHVFGVKTCTPTDTVWYRVVSDGYMPQSQYAFGKVWSHIEGANMKFVDKANDAAQYFCFVLDAATGKVKIMNKKTGKYMTSGFNCNDEAGELFSMTSLGLNSFKINPASGDPIHAQASGSFLVKWQGVVGSASAWRFKEVKFKTITVAPASAEEGTVEITAPTATTAPLTIESNADVTVTATPEVGYTFTKWVDVTTGTEVDLSTEPTYTYSGSDNITLKAVFAAIPKYTITLVSTAGGSAAFDGSSGVTELVDVLEGTELTVVATASSDQVFVEWVDNSDQSQLSKEATYTFTVTKDITIKPVFGNPTQVERIENAVRPIVVNRAIVAGDSEVKVYSIAGVQIQNKNLANGVYFAKVGVHTYKVSVNK